MKLPIGKIQARLAPAFTFGVTAICLVKIFLAPRTIPRYIPVIVFSSVCIFLATSLYVCTLLRDRGNPKLYVVPLAIFMGCIMAYLFVEGRNFFPAYYAPNPMLSYSFLFSILLALFLIGFSAFIFPTPYASVVFIWGVVYFFFLNRLKFAYIDLLLLPILIVVAFFIFLLFHLLRILYFNLQWERKLAKELAAAKEKLINQEKLTTLATFAAGTAHEINNPVTHMFGNIDFLDDYFQRLRNSVHVNSLDKKERKRVDEALRETPLIIEEYRKGFKRIIDTVENMKRIFRQKSSLTEHVELTSLIESVADKFRKDSGEAVEINCSFSKPMYLSCSPGDIISIFQNVISNALEALNGSGKIDIIGTFKENELEFLVKDDGKGIKPEFINEVFHPFFSTKPEKSNMGIGLTLSKTIAEQYGGSIRIESEENIFTKVYIAFPLLKEKE